MNIETIKTFQTLKTPFYYYDTTLLQATLQAASQAANEHGFNLHYAIKANANPHILDIIQSHGIGADCVSGNEVAQAVASGFPSEQIVYAGVGKSDEEIRLALEKEIFCFNCESLPEIEVINMLAGEMGKKASVALRVNPTWTPTRIITSPRESKKTSSDSTFTTSTTPSRPAGKWNTSGLSDYIFISAPRSPISRYSEDFV